jgi:hypothetical protein
MLTFGGGKDKGHFMCSVSSLMMGDIGEVSQCIRLETLNIDFVDDGTGNKVAVATTAYANIDAPGISPTKENSVKRHAMGAAVPAFQFHYDSGSYRQGFIGEVVAAGKEGSLNKNHKFLRRKQRLQEQIANEAGESMMDQFSASMTIEDYKTTEDQPVTTEEIVLISTKEKGITDK